MKKIACYIILLLVLRTAFAQEPEGGIGIRPNPIILHDTRFVYQDLIFRNIDTSLLDFHRYNDVHQWEYPALYTGNPGQKYVLLSFDPDHEIGFRSGFDLFERYFLHTSEIRYYDTKTPYSDLFLTVGAEEEVQVRGIHSQNIGPQFNMGIDYKRNSSQGSFNRNKGIIQNLVVHSWFKTKNEGYHLMTAILLNKAEIEENGGLAIDSIYTGTGLSTRNRQLIPVNLQDAQNIHKERVLNIQQYLYPGQVRQPDKDSVGTKARKGDWRIGLNTQYQNNRYAYTDDERSPGYYENFFFSEDGTNDRTDISQFSQDISVDKTFRGAKHAVGLSAFSRYSLIKYEQFPLDGSSHDFRLGGSVHFNPDLEGGPVSVRGGANFVLSPEYFGDVHLFQASRFQLNEMMSLQFITSFSRRTPAVKEQEFFSNHYFWVNSFKRETLIKNSLLFECTHGDILGELTHHYIGNFVYSGTDGSFEQYDRGLHVLIFKASKLFDFNHIGMFTEMIAQYRSSPDVLDFPAFYVRQSVYYKGGFISGKVQANLGLDIWYHTNYFANAYNPAINEFYVQEDQKHRYLPIFDVFFDIKIKRARVFLQMQNIAQGLIGDGYYTGLDLPGQDRAFKAGVRWQFYD